MQKYWMVFQQAFQETLTFRFELLIWILLDTVPTIILFFVWQTIFSQTQQIQGYTFSSMVEFYFYFSVIVNLTSAHFERNYVERIRKGQIDQYLTRPLSFPQAILWHYVATKLFYFLMLIPSLAFIAFVAQKFFGVQFSIIDFSKGLQFFILLASTFAIEFLLALIIVMLGFWLEGAEGLEHFKWITITMLSGAIIPRAFMPGWLKILTNITPFQYMYGVPIEIIQGRHTLQLLELAPIIGFLLLLSGIAWLLWKKAVYKYTSAGG